MHFNGPNLTILMQKVNWWAMFSWWWSVILGGIDLQCLSPFCWHTCCPTVNWSQYVRLYDNHFNRKIPTIWLKHGRGRLFWKIWIWSFFLEEWVIELTSNWLWSYGYDEAHCDTCFFEVLFYDGLSRERLVLTARSLVPQFFNSLSSHLKVTNMALSLTCWDILQSKSFESLEIL